MTIMMGTGPTATQDFETPELTELLEGMRDTLLTYARRRVGVHRSEEILSEVYEAAIRAEGADREVNPAWLMTVVRNKVIDHWRRTEREARLVEKLRAECPLLAEEHPGEAPSEYGEVAVTLGKLKPRYRSILVRHYVAGEPVGCIAESDGVSYRAMESAMARARRSFRDVHGL